MVDIIVGKKFIEEYCYHLQKNPPYGIALLFPKEEIEQYWDYAVTYGTFTDQSEYTIGREKDKSINKHICDIHVSEYDVLVFEFPDDYPEEELLYFKLKYC